MPITIVISAPEDAQCIADAHDSHSLIHQTGHMIQDAFGDIHTLVANTDDNIQLMPVAELISIVSSYMDQLYRHALSLQKTFYNNEPLFSNADRQEIKDGFVFLWHTYRITAELYQFSVQHTIAGELDSAVSELRMTWNNIEGLICFIRFFHAPFINRVISQYHWN